MTPSMRTPSMIRKSFDPVIPDSIKISVLIQNLFFNIFDQQISREKF